MLPMVGCKAFLTRAKTSEKISVPRFSIFHYFFSRAHSVRHRRVQELVPILQWRALLVGIISLSLRCQPADLSQVRVHSNTGVELFWHGLTNKESSFAWPGELWGWYALPKHHSNPLVFATHTNQNTATYNLPWGIWGW